MGCVEGRCEWSGCSLLLVFTSLLLGFENPVLEGHLSSGPAASWFYFAVLCITSARCLVLHFMLYSCSWFHGRIRESEWIQSFWLKRGNGGESVGYPCPRHPSQWCASPSIVNTCPCSSLEPSSNFLVLQQWKCLTGSCQHTLISSAGFWRKALMINPTPLGHTGTPWIAFPVFAMAARCSWYCPEFILPESVWEETAKGSALVLVAI